MDKINAKAYESVKYLNSNMEATGASGGKAAEGLGKFIKGSKLIEKAIKAMKVSDEYVNVASRLNLINDGLQTQEELHDKIFAAANRSGGSYLKMADTIADMGSMSGDAFSSNDELIAFTELMQKGFKIDGTSSSDQEKVIEKLSKGMANGKLQGGDLDSIMKAAPSVYNAIAEYMGLSIDELKKLEAAGGITSDLLKNAMFMAAGDINDKFGTMPITFGGMWDIIKNDALNSFGPIIEKVNEILNSEGVKRFIYVAIEGINLLAEGIGWLLDKTIEYWGFIGPVLAAIGGWLLAGIITKLWATIPPLLLQGTLWSMISSPIFVVILVIGAVIAILKALGVTTEQIFAVIGGAIGFLIGIFKNIFIFIDNFGIAIHYTLEGILYGIANIVIEVVNMVTNALNKIFGTSIGAIDKLSSSYEESVFIEYVNVLDMYDEGSKAGKDLYNGASDKFSDTFDFSKFITDKNPFGEKDTGPYNPPEIPFDPNDFGTQTNPVTVQGTGAGGAVEVDMSDEDMQYLRDIAQRDYINKFSTATLAPNVQFTFGDIHEEADANKVAGRIKRILQEELAVVAEGGY